nr:MAG TPA: hypothetical protein [Caudoviricetes sp.]
MGHYITLSLSSMLRVIVKHAETLDIYSFQWTKSL